MAGEENGETTEVVLPNREEKNGSHVSHNFTNNEDAAINRKRSTKIKDIRIKQSYERLHREKRTNKNGIVRPSGVSKSKMRAEKRRCIFPLSRGGLVVQTEIGLVQFGMPPETIKDTMELGLGIPAYYVVPTERFSRRIGPSQGVNLAEFEFPAYCNFFFKQGKKIVLLVNDADVKDRIRRVFQETLLGPKHWDPEVDFDPSYPKARRPNLPKEMAHFGKIGDSKITVDMLLSFQIFNSQQEIVVASDVNPEVSVKIIRTVDKYFVYDSSNQEIAVVPSEVRIPMPKPLSRTPMLFQPPAFGVTILGSSHGFDPKGSTSGYVLWLNRRGLMVDPPPNSTYLLQQNSIPPSLIDGVIVTHCHADHDAGTFQKILQEGRVTLMTTSTIMGCFLRKYSALSGLSQEFLRGVFKFRPVRIGESIKCRGGILKFFYTLHSIPCVGFEAYFGGKSIVFSADHMNDPVKIRQLCQEGVLSPGRRDELLNFPWHHDVILHEAGVPPIHTPMDTLVSLSDEIKKRVFVVHVALETIPPDSGLQPAIPGVENTIILKDAEVPPHSDALEILELVGSIELFSGLNIKRAGEILDFVHIEEFKKGDTVVTKGEVGTCFYAIMSGVAEVRVSRSRSNTYTAENISTYLNDKDRIKPVLVRHRSRSAEDCASSCEDDITPFTVKTYFAGDYFGEQSLISDSNIRTADILAVTDLRVAVFYRSEFLWLLDGTNILQKMSHMARMRAEGTWNTIQDNAMLRQLSGPQKTQLETYLVKLDFEDGDLIWDEGSPAEYAILIDKGKVTFKTDPSSEFNSKNSSISILLPVTAMNGTSEADPDIFERGSFIGDIDALLADRKNAVALRAIGKVSVLCLYKKDLRNFFSNNPGVLLSMLHTRYIL